jgi:hypothetical protein
MATIEQIRKEKYEKEHKIINEIDHKFCSKHNIYFPEENPWIPANTVYYYVNKSNKTDGLHPWCKKCGREKATIHYYNNIDTEKERSQRPEVKELRNTIHKKWRIDKIEVWQEYYSGYQKREYVKEKCKEYNKNHRIHDITKAEWRGCLKVFNNKCAYCDLSAEEHYIMYRGKRIIGNFHKDHVNHEGYNSLRNAVPACKSCNDKKWIFPMEEWYRQQKFFNEERLRFIYWWITEGYKDYIEDKPPYRILRKKNEGLKTYHFELWTVDEMRNIIECIDIKSKRKELDINKVIPMN